MKLKKVWITFDPSCKYAWLFVTYLWNLCRSKTNAHVWTKVYNRMFLQTYRWPVDFGSCYIWFSFLQWCLLHALPPLRPPFPIMLHAWKTQLICRFIKRCTYLVYWRLYRPSITLSVLITCVSKLVISNCSSSLVVAWELICCYLVNIWVRTICLSSERAWVPTFSVSWMGMDQGNLGMCSVNAPMW